MHVAPIYDYDYDYDYMIMTARIINPRCTSGPLTDVSPAVYGSVPACARVLVLGMRVCCVRVCERVCCRDGQLDDLLPPCSTGPRTLNQTLALAIEHVRSLSTGGSGTARRTA